jgi:hypothetical protein
MVKSNTNTTENKMTYEIRDISDATIYRFLLPAVDGVMRFQSGYGFITEDQIKQNGWVVVPM